MTALPSILPPVSGSASASGPRDSFGSSSEQGNGFADLLVSALGTNGQGSNGQGSAPTSSEAGASDGSGADQSDAALASVGAAALLGAVPLVLTEALRQAALPNLGATAVDGSAGAGVPAAVPTAAPGTSPENAAPASAGVLGGTTAGATAGFGALLAGDQGSPGDGTNGDGAGNGTAAEPVVPPAADPRGNDTDADTASASALSRAGSDAAQSGAPSLTVVSPAGAPGTPASAAAQPGAVDISSLTSVGAVAGTPAPSTVAAPSATAAAPAPMPVDQQVFPEVTRLVQRGDGSHRLTLTLSPEALGDVQVTLVVLKGAVTVSFAANDLAQRALLESAPELRRLLEMTGATDTRVIVRDAAAPAPATQASSNTAQQGSPEGGQDGTAGADAHSQGEKNDRDAQADQLVADQFADHLAGRARGESQNQHARMRDGFTATDGTHRGTSLTGGPLDPDASTGYTRVDVTV